MVSGTSLHIKNRLVQHCEKACAFQAPIYTCFRPLILQIVHWRKDFMCVFACAHSRAACFTLFSMCLVSEEQGQRISLLILCLHSSPCPKLILILNVCSGSRSGQVRDCLHFPPSGHLKLHLIQMPICSTQIGGWNWLPGWLACLGILCPHSTKVRMPLRACVHT